MVKWDAELGTKSANTVPPQYVCSYFYWLWLAALQFAFVDGLLIFTSVENTSEACEIHYEHVKYTTFIWAISFF